MNPSKGRTNYSTSSIEGAKSPLETDTNTKLQKQNTQDSQHEWNINVTMNINPVPFFAENTTISLRFLQLCEVVSLYKCYEQTKLLEEIYTQRNLLKL